MGVFDRLGDVIRSYLNDTGPGPAAGSETKVSSAGRRYADPDLDAAYEELDDFLAGKRTKADEEGNASYGSTKAGNAGNPVPPESLRRDFDELGVPFGAPADACKAAYKKLLKIHHPDRHAAEGPGHEGNGQKATDKSARINTAYDRIEKWRETGKA
jgi:DnaJ-domain-containing protein 1